MKQKVINALMFKIGWLGVVFLGSGTLHWTAPILVTMIVGFHLIMCRNPKIELKLILVAVLMGALWESFIASQGLVIYAHGQPGTYLAPAWIVAMWALLATTLNVNLAWMRGRPFLTILFGAIGGPCAFLAGEKLGAVTFPDPLLTLIVLALGWSALMLALVSTARNFDGYNATSEPIRSAVPNEVQYEN
ncbi:MAG: DUF2878 domain-containing protein [Pseudomonadota bacterium]